MTGILQRGAVIPRGRSDQDAAALLDKAPHGAARIDLVDGARGIALLAMAIYHFSWDLSFLQLIVTEVGIDPAWKWFARAIAGSFLFLVGVSLVLGHGEEFHPRPFAKRLAMITIAAASITVVTFFAFPDSYIFFGILHCIALSSVLALPFLRMPWPLVIATAIVVVGAPRIAASHGFNAPLLAWLGLGTRVPQTNDYVPIFPWFGMVLAGVAAARALAAWTRRLAVRRWRAKNPLSRILALAGRHSLLVYLLHQPALLAILYPVAQWAGPNPAVQEARFLQSCAELRREEAACRRVWSCFESSLKERDLWIRALKDQLTGDEKQAVRALSRQCFVAES